MKVKKENKVVTTENEVVAPAVEKKAEVSSDDAKKLRDAYVKGATIDDLADEFGYMPKQVEAVVVTEVPAPSEPPTQAELDANASQKDK